ncbi:MAG: hypothetical protein LBG11_01630, partial [Bifidobacteriaceae bacterium]|nr:hypothetical protein [Bifidobacteriaceae bacterium]
MRSIRSVIDTSRICASIRWDAVFVCGPAINGAAVANATDPPPRHRQRKVALIAVIAALAVG